MCRDARSTTLVLLKNSETALSLPPYIRFYFILLAQMLDKTCRSERVGQSTTWLITQR